MTWVQPVGVRTLLSFLHGEGTWGCPKISRFSAKLPAPLFQRGMNTRAAQRDGFTEWRKVWIGIVQNDFKNRRKLPVWTWAVFIFLSIVLYKLQFFDRY